MIGKSLAHYSITARIGKGGMGEVYQATDAKLGRSVAIKVLPEEFAKDADRIARFQREAKLLASLNHPNIAAIHGLEEADGAHFLVLELIEGQTLAERIKAGPIPVEEALKLGLQIAEALEAAHEKGVIHRDLKPANIKVTPEGKVKVLDFGLAKAYAGDPESMNLSNSPTLSDMATQQGVILGTAAYMPPEQAKGKTVDKRADIWAFGVVLFEMLTGRQLFAGETVSETLAAVIKSEPEWNNLPSNLHTRIRLMLERCLEKDPKRRYGAINDAIVDIEKVLADPGGVYAQPVAASEPKAKSRQMLLWAAATAVLIIIAGIVAWNLKTQESRQVMRFDFDIPNSQQLLLTDAPTFAVSRDGKQIVYCTEEGIYLRPIDEINAKLIPGSDARSQNPTFSPDGKSLAYFSTLDRKLKKIAIAGGAPTVLCNIDDFRGESWHENEFIVFCDSKNGIMKVSSKGGTPEVLVEKKTDNLFDPQFLADGTSIIYTAAGDTFANRRVMIKSSKSEEPKELFAGWFLRYLPSGRIIYWDSEDNLCAVVLDSDTLETSGEQVPIIPGVAKASISDTGTLIYTSLPQASQSDRSKYTLVWVDKEGREEPLGIPPNQYDYPKISPDGKKLVVVIGNYPTEDIWIYDLERKTLNKLTLEETREIQPIWSPDSKQILYWANYEDNAMGGIYRRAFDGSGEVEKIISIDRQVFPWSISRDGKFLLLQELASMINADISMLSLDGERERKPLLQNEFSEAQPTISPNGSWMAYCSSESTGQAGETEVFIRPFPDVNKRRWPVSNGGGNCPLWSPDGKELFYLSTDNFVMSVSVKEEPTLTLGTPKQLFKNTNLGFNLGSGPPWDIYPDGKRFLMIKPPAGVSTASAALVPNKISIILNWDEVLKERVPVD